MRKDVQEIFRMTPHEKQVMMFSATLSKDIRPVCKKFMMDVRDSTPLSDSVSATLCLSEILDCLLVIMVLGLLGGCDTNYCKYEFRRTSLLSVRSLVSIEF